MGGCFRVPSKRKGGKDCQLEFLNGVESRMVLHIRRHGGGGVTEDEITCGSLIR